MTEQKEEEKKRRWKKKSSSSSSSRSKKKDEEQEVEEQRMQDTDRRKVCGGIMVELDELEENEDKNKTGGKRRVSATEVGPMVYRSMRGRET